MRPAKQVVWTTVFIAVISVAIPHIALARGGGSSGPGGHSGRTDNTSKGLQYQERNRVRQQEHAREMRAMHKKYKEEIKQLRNRHQEEIKNIPNKEERQIKRKQFQEEIRAR